MTSEKETELDALPPPSSQEHLLSVEEVKKEHIQHHDVLSFQHC
jgi:hypothetical protein